MNVVGCARLAVRALNIQGVKIFMHLDDHAIHQRDKAFTILIRTFNNFIINIGDITDVLQGVT